MSINMDSSNSTSYGDYQHEQLEYNINNTSGVGQNAFVEIKHDPLERKGGLDNDEVAELVGYEANIIIAKDPAPNGAVEDGLYEHRGVWGVNLQANDITSGPPSGTDAADFDTNRIVSVDTDVGTDTSAPSYAAETIEQGVFLQYDIVSDAAGESIRTSKHMRDWYDRGPVIDATDELSFIGAAIKQDGTEADMEATLSLNLIWDIAVVEGVRNRFSLPEGFR